MVYRGYVKVCGSVAIKTGKGSQYTKENRTVIILIFSIHAALLGVTEKERLLKEVSFMLTFSHPNVMPLIGLSFDEETPLVIMPFMSNGTVLSYVRENKKNLYFLESSDKLQV